MNIDKASFFLALGTLAAGGAGGWLVRDRNLLAGTQAPTEPTGLGVTAAQPAGHPAASATGSAAPVCDDAVGAPAACPPAPYSADESGCAPIATRRCEEFKQSMKPRVAEHAVTCLLALGPSQRCDANRVNLCGHEALMNACSAADTPMGASAGAAGDDLDARCQAIVQTCPGASLRECRETLAGMNAVGRARITSCMSAHCADKGLLGCESAGDAK
jgi:hypothetical protein